MKTPQKLMCLHLIDWEITVKIPGSAKLQTSISSIRFITTSYFDKIPILVFKNLCN